MDRSSIFTLLIIIIVTFLVFQNACRESPPDPIYLYKYKFKVNYIVNGMYSDEMIADTLSFNIKCTHTPRIYMIISDGIPCLDVSCSIPLMGRYIACDVRSYQILESSSTRLN